MPKRILLDGDAFRRGELIEIKERQDYDPWLDGPRFKCEHCGEWKSETSLNLVCDSFNKNFAEAIRRRQVCVDCAVKLEAKGYSIALMSAAYYLVRARQAVTA